jgi:hypothetical protein
MKTEVVKATLLEAFRMTGVLDRYLVYLDGLRISGVTNMFGARPFLQDEFGLTQAEASVVLGYWMKTFEERHP